MRNARKSAAASQCLPFYGPHIVFCFLLRCFVFVFRSRALPLSLIFENLIKRPLVGPSKVRASIGHKSWARVTQSPYSVMCHLEWCVGVAAIYVELNTVLEQSSTTHVLRMCTQIRQIANIFMWSTRLQVNCNCASCICIIKNHRNTPWPLLILFIILSYRRLRPVRCDAHWIPAREIAVRPRGVLPDTVPQPAHEIRQVAA